MAGMTMAFEKGMQLAEEGQFADAIACFRKAIAEGLETPEVFECLAQCEMMLDTLSSSQRAVVAAQEALQRLGAEEAPGRLSWVDATLTLARALRCNFDLPAAVDAYHAAVRLGASAPAELQSAEEELLEHRRRLKRLPSMEGWHRRFQRQIDRAKRLRRPEWSAEKWRSNNLAAMDLTQIFGRGKGNITRVTGSADFGALYQGTSTPVVLVGAMHGWAAMKSWSMERFTEDFGHQKMICDWCFGLRLRLNDFAEYAATQADDDPLYLFDHLFGEYPATKSLLDEYQVPSVFGEDLLAGLGSLRPPYRWLLVGPRRSGSKVHQDPLGTSAWNALISGRKLWVLFPPKTPAEKLRPESNELKELDSAAGWFLGWWQKAREEEWPKEFQPIERLGVVWVHPVAAFVIFYSHRQGYDCSHPEFLQQMERKRGLEVHHCDASGARAPAAATP
ncbi:unnamed protein product [Durusdinium trenchii]|uniref:JmjC domain-containing protein n=1 Tax=Durusdinium trenchii TaxID=1381693 RepID=A0ABP0HSL7_9DINO